MNCKMNPSTAPLNTNHWPFIFKEGNSWGEVLSLQEKVPKESYKIHHFFLSTLWSPQLHFPIKRGSNICLLSINALWQGEMIKGNNFLNSFCQDFSLDLVNWGSQTDWSKVLYKGTCLGFFNKTNKIFSQAIVHSTAFGNLNMAILIKFTQQLFFLPKNSLNSFWQSLMQRLQILCWILWWNRLVQGRFYQVT